MRALYLLVPTYACAGAQGHLPPFMYRNSKKYIAGEHAAHYLAVAELALTAQADRLGVGVGVLRVLVQLAALRSSGATVKASDMQAAGLASERTLVINLAECKRLGWVESKNGKLGVLSAGRAVVAKLSLAWDRSASQLAAFTEAIPYRPRPAGRQDDLA
jgi:hypothetical protein